jgi:hypothetical protein
MGDGGGHPVDWCSILWSVDPTGSQVPYLYGVILILLELVEIHYGTTRTGTDP